jgi:hypothetical protein
MQGIAMHQLRVILAASIGHLYLSDIGAACELRGDLCTAYNLFWLKSARMHVRISITIMGLCAISVNVILGLVPHSS